MSIIFRISLSSCSKNPCNCSGDEMETFVSISGFLSSIGMSIRAILAPLTMEGISCEIFSLSKTIPEISSVSSMPSPFDFSIFMSFKSTLKLSSEEDICFTARTIISANFSFDASAPLPVMAVIAICLNISSSSRVILNAISLRIS